MSYIVLARKYRPQTFKEIYSQEHITQILSNAIKTNRIAHAYLFNGPRGVGKTSMARILAKSLNCVEGPTDTPCGVCHNCKEITASTSTDVIEIDGASNTGVDDVRELQRELFYAPSQSLYKIYIIDEVHMLSKNAFNALLKTLEEPPENVVFIFATTEPFKVLPTIISRCQRFDFRRIPVEDITARLREIANFEGIDIDDESLYLVARKSDGGLRDALSLLDQILSYSDGSIKINLVQEVFGELPLTMYANIMAAILEHDPIQLIQYYHEVINQGIDLVEFINSFMEFMRQLISLKIGIPIKGLVKDDLDIINNIVAVANLNNLMYIMTVLIQLKQDMRTSSHPSLLIEVVLIKMSRLDEMEDLAQILTKLDKMPAESRVINAANDATVPAAAVKSTTPVIPKREETIEIEYVSPTKVQELTLEHVLENWDAFVDMVKVHRKMLAIYLKKEHVTKVKSDIIFMEFTSTNQYTMINDSIDALNESLTKFFNLPVKLIIRLVEAVHVEAKKNPTLQEIRDANPEIGKLIDLTNSLILPE